MAHTSEKRWNSKRNPDGSVREGVNAEVGQRAERVMQALVDGEELFQQLIELWTYTGATAQGLADQLFADEIAARGDVMANSVELAMANDLKDATMALHELYLSVTNQTITPDPNVAAKGRDGSLRRMI